MSVFYMHLHECGSVYLDEGGQDLPDLAAAREQALYEARNIMSHEVLKGALCLGCSIVIEDSAHREVLRLPFREAISLSGL